jgi:hypothetical protein
MIYWRKLCGSSCSKELKPVSGRLQVSHYWLNTNTRILWGHAKQKWLLNKVQVWLMNFTSEFWSSETFQWSSTNGGEVRKPRYFNAAVQLIRHCRCLHSEQLRGKCDNSFFSYLIALVMVWWPGLTVDYYGFHGISRLCWVYFVLTKVWIMRNM